MINRSMIEKKGDKWWVCRMENATMRVFVGEYNTEWEAQIAHEESQKHYKERVKWLEKHRSKLKSRIQKKIEQKRK